MPTKNLVITDYQSQWVESLVKSGRYQNASEVMREGLRLLEERDRDFEARITALKAQVQVGLTDIEAGHATRFASVDDAALHLRHRGQALIRAHVQSKQAEADA